MKANVQICPTADDVREHLWIILGDEASYNTTLNWAIQRCKMAYEAPDHELKDRLLYILGNITYWRHPQAKQVRNVFKQYIKEAS